MAHRRNKVNIPIPKCGFLSTYYTSLFSGSDYPYHLVVYQSAGVLDIRLVAPITRFHLFEAKSCSYFCTPLPKEFCKLVKNVHKFPHLPVPYIKGEYLHLICFKHYIVLPVLFEKVPSFPNVCAPVLPVFDMHKPKGKIPVFYVSENIFEELKSAYFCRTTAKAILPVMSSQKVVVFNNPFTSATWDIDHRIYGKISTITEVEQEMGINLSQNPPPGGPDAGGFPRSSHTGGGDTDAPRGPNVGQQGPNLQNRGHGGGRGGAPYDGVSDQRYNSVDRLFNVDPANLKLSADEFNRVTSAFRNVDLRKALHNLMDESFIDEAVNLFAQYRQNPNDASDTTKITVHCNKQGAYNLPYRHYIVQTKLYTTVTTYVEFPTTEFLKIKRSKFLKTRYPVDIHNSTEMGSFVDNNVMPRLPQNPLAKKYGTTPNASVVAFLDSMRASKLPKNTISITKDNPLLNTLSKFSNHINLNFENGIYRLFPKTEFDGATVSEKTESLSVLDEMIRNLTFSGSGSVTENRLDAALHRPGATADSSPVLAIEAADYQNTEGEQTDLPSDSDESTSSEWSDEALTKGLNIVNKFVDYYSVIADNVIIPVQNVGAKLLLLRP